MQSTCVNIRHQQPINSAARNNDTLISLTVSQNKIKLSVVLTAT